MFGRKPRLWTVAIVIVLLVASLSIVYVKTTQNTMTTTTSQPTSVSTQENTTQLAKFLVESAYIPTFGLNQTLALSFYSRLMVSVDGGDLFETFPGSQTIYLADDQVLDYSALENMSSQTSLQYAMKVNETISSFGGFYEYWNPVFVVLGDYPSNWIIKEGFDEQVGSTVSNGVNYALKATEFYPAPGFNYSEFADQEFYYALWNLHEGNYSGAEAAFANANDFWNGYGFEDNASSPGFYTSYKLAVDVIAWKDFEANPSTASFANSYIPEIKNVTSVMSQLQGKDGGVWTNYVVENGQIITGTNISFENGETTSLFVIAADTA